MAGIPHIQDERILATWDGGEDAALWTIDEHRLGVLTVDFITPVVDDPYIWGQVAAANSISDVFAMGGRPIVALNVVCFPTKQLELDILKSILEGGFFKTREAGAVLVGGHSVQDDEPKYGLVVYGEVDRDRMWRTIGALPDDVLVLTKPIGTGIAITGIKAGMIEDPRTAEETALWMTKLNDLPRHLDEKLHHAVHAATDVTGFGLAGHVLDMLSAGGLDARLELERIPALPGVKELANLGLVPEGSHRNHLAYEERIDLKAAFDDATLDLLYDAQTSGGLLLAVEPEHAEPLLQLCRRTGFIHAAAIGQFRSGSGRVEAV